MRMTIDPRLVETAAALMLGTVLALGIWLLAGDERAATFGFVIAAVASATGARRSCRRAPRGGPR